MILDQMESAIALGAGVTIVSDMFRSLFFLIDGFIYGFIPTVYNLMYSLYDFSTLVGEGTLNNILNSMTTTVYSFLAIFMFFRVAFSLITMLVDPSVIDDKERGAKKIVTNIMICLVLIVAVPYVFRYAKVIQTRVIEDRLIEQIFTGEAADEGYDLGNEMALSVWSVFFRPVGDTNDAAVSAYNAVFNSRSSNWDLKTLQDELDTKSSGILASKDAQYSLSYVYLFSTLAGLYVAWMFIKVMIDVAYRSIKFFVLELLSPIAIVSYIDPTSGKKGLFSKWLNETVKTYASLFIRIFVFSFATVLLRTFSLSDLSGDKLWVNFFYMLAIIAFIKTGPKFIDNLFGTSMSKEGESNLAKGMKSVLGFTGGATGAVAGGISGAVAANTAGKNRLVAGFKGAWEGGKKGATAGKKGGFAGVEGIYSNVSGSYGDAKKKYGINIDEDQEKLINSLLGKVDAINAAKGAAVDDLMANNGQKYNEILENGVKVNDRKYGKGLDGDEGLESLLKKNSAGLAQDELLHEGDSEYLMYRRAVAKAKETNAILSRVNSKAHSQHKSDEYAYSTASDKTSYIISFETDTARMQYEGMDDRELTEKFRSSLQSLGTNYINSERQKFDLATKAQKIDLVVNSSNLDRAQVSAMSIEDLSSEYQRILTQNAQKEINDRVTNYQNASSKENRIDIAVNAVRNSVGYEISLFDEAALKKRFDNANNDRIEVEYGQALTNIEYDAEKADGDVKNAQKNLDDYLNGRGKKAKSIDVAYSLADARAKAKKLAEERNKNNN